MIGLRLSHYRIVEQIGAGGMGVVYRAHDEQLDRDVAIKVLPPGSLSDESAHKRFRKEALSLARLNHPNIATVHEFGSQDGADFLVTEYIAGITLDAKLARGPLAPADVARLGMQLAAGLAAAHEQGVVHRDLKPGNLRITTDGRLKILDFGLAQFAAQPSELGMTVTLTKSQETSGTLPYMSPEQLSGEGADARSDIWAAGAVLYEMATGKRPFPQSVPALLINAILNQVPEVPSKINPAVPASLEAVILKALAREQAQRHQTAGELGLDLERAVGSASSRSAAFAIQPSPRRGGLIFALAALVVACAIGGYLFLHRKQTANPALLTSLSNSSAQANRRRSIAVLGFKNLSGNPEKSWLSTALAEMMTTELSQGDELRAIPGESVAQMKVSLALPDADSYSQQTLTRIRQNLGSDDVVLGSYVPLGNGLLRLDVRLQDAVAGETLASVSEKGSESEIDSLVSKAGAELRAKLGVGALSDEQSAQVRASLPSNAEAARLYALGLQKLRVFDVLAARDLLEKAAALAPEHAPTHSALAEAWSTLGYAAKAREQAKRALDLSSNFSREDRLLIEGRSHELMGEPQLAVESYHALWALFPDRVDYGVLLIRAQITSGHGSEADSTLAELHKLQLSDADAARVDLSEATIAWSQSDFKRSQATGERAATRGAAIGATLLAAEGLRLEADACEQMGQTDKAGLLLSQAKNLYDSAGYRQGAARTLLMLGDMSYDQGDFAGARKQFEDALPVFRGIGDQRRIRATMERIGNVCYQQGKLRESEDYYNQALRIDRDFNDADGLASDYGNLANSLDSLGDLKGALKMQEQALAAFNGIGKRSEASATLNNLGNLWVEMGNLGEAKKNFDQAIALARETDFLRGEPYPIAGLGDVLQAQGDLAGARKQYDQALALCEEIKDDDCAAQVRTAMASTDLHGKHFSEAEALVRQAAAIFDKTKSATRPWSHAVLARILLSEGNLKEASSEADKAVATSREAAGKAAQYEAALADSRVKAKSGNSAEARKELEGALASAHKFGYRLFELQMRLAMGEIETWSGAASAHAELAALEKDAKAQGASLVAGEAQALLADPRVKAK